MALCTTGSGPGRSQHFDAALRFTHQLERLGELDVGLLEAMPQ